MADLFDVSVGGVGWHFTSHLIALAALFIACFAIAGYITFRDNSIPGDALKDHDVDVEDIVADSVRTSGDVTVGGSLVQDGFKTGFIRGSAAIPVTAAVNTDITLGVLPANTRIRNLFFMFNSVVTTGGTDGDDLDFSLGISGTPGSLIVPTAIADDAGGAVTIDADTYYYLVTNGVGSLANALDATGGSANPATSEAVAITNATSTSDRTLIARFTPLQSDLAATGTVTVILEYISDYSA